jgi:hypothetical protein
MDIRELIKDVERHMDHHEWAWMYTENHYMRRLVEYIKEKEGLND